MLFTLFSPTLGHAQSASATPADGMFRGVASDDQDKRKLGWSKEAKIGANASFTSNENVVGQTDGSSQTYGLNLNIKANRLRELDEWRNEFTLIESTTKTPSLPSFTKSGDELKLSSIYLKALESHPKIGPYVKAEGAAPIFKGEDSRAKIVTYRIRHKDQSVESIQGSRLRLTDGLRPLTTKESVGTFWKILEGESLKIEGRVGLGAMQVQADGQYSAGTPDSNGDVPVRALRNLSQAGFEAALGLRGKVNDHASYEIGVETLTPVINNKQSGDKRDAIALTNLDGFAKYTTKIYSWASLSYDYKVKMQPQLIERAQQTHMVVLNISYSVF